MLTPTSWQWENGRYENRRRFGYFSRIVWLDDLVKAFSAERLSHLVQLLELAYRRGHEEDYAKLLFWQREKFFAPTKKAQFAEMLADLYADCAVLELDAAVMALRRAIDHLNQPKFSVKTFAALSKDALQVLTDQLASRAFFSLNLEEIGYYYNPAKDWEIVIDKWPQTRIDIEESSRCYACGRYAAAIFHALLVAEFGVIKVSVLLDIAGDKPGWSALDRLEKIRKKPYEARSPLEQTYSKLLDDLSPLMLSMKNSWRHKISHVDNRLEWLDTDFSPQLAEEIIVAVRGFMRQLAKDLPK